MVHVFFHDKHAEHIEEAVRIEAEPAFAQDPQAYAGPTVFRLYDKSNQPVAQFNADDVSGYQVNEDPVVTLVSAGSIKKE